MTLLAAGRDSVWIVSSTSSEPGQSLRAEFRFFFFLFEKSWDREGSTVAGKHSRRMQL